MTLFVKLCGISDESQLEAAVGAGADAVGFVLTPSPRQVSVDTAARLRALLPASVMAVAVFHDPSPRLLRQAESVVAPDLLQSEVSTLAGVLPDRALPVVVDGPSLHRDLSRAFTLTTREMVLVDSAARGGTGRPAGWERLAGIEFPGRLVLAGGLDPGNVGDAVGLVKPFGVDVSSGVESAPGVKDPTKMRAFVEAAREASSPPVGHTGTAAAGGSRITGEEP